LITPFAIIDNNGQCVTDYTKDCVNQEPLADKWKAFGWNVIVVDGHSFEELISAFSRIESAGGEEPFMIIARTIKGKGVSFMEGGLKWHHSVPKGDDLANARRELERF